MRRKQVDSAHPNPNPAHLQLAKELTVPHLIPIGHSHSYSLLSYYLTLTAIALISPLVLFSLPLLSGVGSTIGAGVYILVGTVARELAGPALAFSFLIAGIAAALSAFCYAELSSRCPSAGSAYHYSYICVGEGYASPHTTPTFSISIPPSFFHILIHQ